MKHADEVDADVQVKEQGGDGQCDEHEKEAKDIEIVVNGREKTVPKGDYTFAQIVALAFNPVPTGENIVFTITYRRGHGHKPEGVLAEDETVKVKEGMIFNVKATDKS